MALEIGSVVLKGLYKLARIIKEAHDDVLSVVSKLDIDEDLLVVLEALLSRTNSTASSLVILGRVHRRCIENRRILRRVRLKYDPLAGLLQSLGGDATQAKSEATFLRKGLLGCIMTLKAISIMGRHHLESLQHTGTAAEGGVEASLNVKPSVMENVSENGSTDRSIYQEASFYAEKSSKALLEGVVAAADLARENIPLFNDSNHNQMHTDRPSTVWSGNGRDKLTAAAKQDYPLTGRIGTSVPGVRGRSRQTPTLVPFGGGHGSSEDVDDDCDEDVVDSSGGGIHGGYDGSSFNWPLHNDPTNDTFTATTTVGSNERLENSVCNLLSEIDGISKELQRLYRSAEDEDDDDDVKEGEHLDLFDRLNAGLDAVQTEFASSFKRMQSVFSVGGDDEGDNNDEGGRRRNGRGELSAAATETADGSAMEEDNRKHARMFAGIDLMVDTLAQGATVVSTNMLKQAFGRNWSQTRADSLLHCLRDRQQEKQQRPVQEGTPINATDASAPSLVSVDVFCNYLYQQAESNIGVGVAATCFLLPVLSVASPVEGHTSSQMRSAFLKETSEIVSTLAEPLAAHALSFGLLLCCEHIRQESDHGLESTATSCAGNYKHDTDTDAAKSIDADERTMSSRFKLIREFAADMKDALQYGYAPDPSIIATVGSECAVALGGLMGQKTEHRIRFVVSVLSLLNVEEDKRLLETTQRQLESELQLVSALCGEQSDRILSNVEQQNQRLEALLHNLDLCRILDVDGEVADFWVSSFGSQCYEVPWLRFRNAYDKYFGETTESEFRRAKLLLIDQRGIVTLDHVKAFAKNDPNGSLDRAVAKLNTLKKMPSSMKFFFESTAAAAAAAAAAATVGGLPAVSPPPKTAAKLLRSESSTTMGRTDVRTVDTNSDILSTTSSVEESVSARSPLKSSLKPLRSKTAGNTARAVVDSPSTQAASRVPETGLSFGLGGILDSKGVLNNILDILTPDGDTRLPFGDPLGAYYNNLDRLGSKDPFSGGGGALDAATGLTDGPRGFSITPERMGMMAKAYSMSALTGPRASTGTSKTGAMNSTSTSSTSGSTSSTMTMTSTERRMARVRLYGHTKK